MPAAQLKGELDLEFGKFRAKLAQAVNESARAQDRMKAGGADLGDKMFGGMKNLGALAGVGSVGAAAIVFKDIVSHFDDVAEGAVKLGTSTDSFQRVSFAASQLATNIDAVGGAVLKAEKNIGDLNKSGGREALLRLGLDAETFINLPLEEKLLALSDAYASAEGDGSRMATMQQLLGRGAADLIPLLAEGKEGLEAMFANAPVAADEVVQALAAVNDQLDAMKPKWQVFAGKALGNMATNLEVVWGLFHGDAPGTTMQRQADELNAAMTAADERRSKRKKLSALAEDQREQKTAASEQKKADDEAAKRAERIERLKRETGRQAIDTLPDYQKFQAIAALQDEIFAKMQKSGGLFFEPSIQGLEQWSQAALGKGQMDTAETALGMLKEARSLQKEMDDLNTKIKTDTHKEALANDAVNREKKREELEGQRDALEKAGKAQAPIGGLAGAVSLLTGRDPTALAQLESAREQKRKLDEIERHLKELVQQGRKDRNNPGDTFTD